VDSALFDAGSTPAAQQPHWDDAQQVTLVREQLSRSQPLVRAEDVATLHSQLARVADGRAHVLQSGDCAEDPEECDRTSVLRKAALLDLLAATMTLTTHRPVLRVGRIGGQFCKPRSNTTEDVDGLVLPPYRGHMVNRPMPTVEARRPNPHHILTGYSAAREVMDHLGWRGAAPSVSHGPIWTSHEALLLDYELPMLRPAEDGKLLLTSTHWPWIGARTGQLDGVHVALLARLVNPIACKVGPRTTADGLLALCERLDPDRVPGRLTLIVRMGAGAVSTLLPPLVRAVRAAGHPVIWLSDPMHANTVRAPCGRKTRYLESIVREVRAFQLAVRGGGGTPGGLHLETTPNSVSECVADESAVHEVPYNYTTFCDPRLTAEQALLVASAWQSESELSAHNDAELATGELVDAGLADAGLGTPGSGHRITGRSRLAQATPRFAPAHR
jgi:3-deoxy-7-phosphoheptulonate synthase